MHSTFSLGAETGSQSAASPTAKCPLRARERRQVFTEGCGLPCAEQLDDDDAELKVLGCRLTY